MGKKTSKGNNYKLIKSASIGGFRRCFFNFSVFLVNMGNNKGSRQKPLTKKGAADMLSHEQLSAFKTELLKSKKDLEEHLKQNDHFDLRNGHFHESMGELSSYDNHQIGRASCRETV